ncbi:MAG: 4-(cytidine 5'-diphospho)-2-C-methyl-D-erythritol kinase, partial [Pseudomonadota bacterium]
MLAPAKINLDLRVLGRRADGYHELDSTVVFAALGDRLVLKGSPGDLTIDGPFAPGLSAGADNLVLRSAQAVASAAGRDLDVGFHLTKTLPAAAGLGGGSSDAATAMLLLVDRWDLDPTDIDLNALASSVGADVPVCLIRQSTRMIGIGEKTTLLAQEDRARLSGLPVLLVNPRQPVSTQQVFAALAQGETDQTADPLPDTRLQQNDLIAPALNVVPAIGTVLGALSSLDQATRFGMSGSGPSCFALFERMADCQAAARQISAINSDWW